MQCVNHSIRSVAASAEFEPDDRDQLVLNQLDRTIG
jgi:hypothetical protein